MPLFTLLLRALTAPTLPDAHVRLKLRRSSP